MNLIKPETWAETLAPRILIRVDPGEPEVMKEGFSIVSRLHQAGYVAELNLSAQEPANLRWTIDVQSKAPQFILTDLVKHRKSEVQTDDEVLMLINR